MKKKRKNVGQFVAMLGFVAVGMACGLLIAAYMDSLVPSDKGAGVYLLFGGFLILAMYAVIYLQIIWHEAGHLVCGLLSGYRFCSFRIGNLIWVKENETLHLRRLSIAGTGGQCLMLPPEPKDGRIPVMLYNLGGPLANLLTGVLAFGGYLLLKEQALAALLLLMTAIIGFAFAAINGIPMRMNGVDNDGYNAFSLGKNPQAIRSFWIQLKMQELIAGGTRLSKMPKEWFRIPSDEEMKNSMTAVMGVFACNRLMDEQRFDEADEQMQHLLGIESGITGLHKNLMICDQIYCELIGKNREERLEQMLNKEQKKFMKAMKKFPSVLRTRYAYALLAKKDVAEAAEVEQQFERCAKKYPYPSEVQGERELMQIAKSRTGE